MTVHMSLECVQPLLGRYVRSMVIRAFTGLTLVYVIQRLTLCIMLNQLEGMCMYLLYTSIEGDSICVILGKRCDYSNASKFETEWYRKIYFCL